MTATPATKALVDLLSYTGDDEQSSALKMQARQWMREQGRDIRRAHMRGNERKGHETRPGVERKRERER